MSAILDFIFSPYAPSPRCLPVSKMLFRVHTTINTHKSLGAFHVDTSNSCLLPPIFPHYLDAILDFGVVEMSQGKNDARNGISMLKLVENDVLFIQIAPKMRFLEKPDFSMAAILDCILPPYAPVPRCLPGSKMLFRVHTTRNNHKIQGASKGIRGSKARSRTIWAKQHNISQRCFLGQYTTPKF